ncbi:MAG: ligand-binding sensor domain-containing protein [Bacteroidota bacterium]
MIIPQQLLQVCVALLLSIALTSCLEQSALDPSVLDTWTQIRAKDGLAGDDVTAIFKDDKGNIWFGTTSGLSMYNQSYTSFRKNNGLPSNYITSITQDNDGRIWVGTDAGLSVYVNNSWIVPEVFLDITITALLETSGGHVVVGTACCGAFEFRTDDANFYYFYNPNSCAPCNYINTIYEDGNERIWLGTDDGIKRIEKNSGVTSFKESDGLPGNYVTAITEDKWGNFWIGTFDGFTLAKMTEMQITQVGLANLQQANWIRSLLVDRRGILWVATGSNGLYQFDGAYMRRMTDRFKEEKIGPLLLDEQGNIWIGTTSGAYRYTPGIGR